MICFFIESPFYYYFQSNTKQKIKTEIAKTKIKTPSLSMFINAVILTACEDLYNLYIKLQKKSVSYILFIIT